MRGLRIITSKTFDSAGLTVVSVAANALAIGTFVALLVQGKYSEFAISGACVAIVAASALLLRPPVAKRPRWIIPTAVAMIVLGAAVLGGSVTATYLARSSGPVMTAPSAELASSEGKILSPEGPFVPKTFRLSGIQDGLDKSDEIWGLSRRYDDGQFYPMNKACVRFDEEDRFDCGAYYLGNQEGGDVGAEFDLLIVEADVQAVGEFQRAQIQNEPLEQLPSGSKILDRIRVTRT